MKINIKFLFYFTASTSLMIITYFFVTFINLEIQKYTRKEESRNKLDKFYFKELGTCHFSLLDRKRKNRDSNLARVYEWLSETQEHMSQDGYNWQQIDEISKNAERNEKANLWSHDEGYEDAIADRPINPEKDIEGTASFEIRAYYLSGYEEGKKAREGRSLTNNC